MRIAAMAFSAFCLLGIHASAQSTQALITGQVRDRTTGRPIGEAIVRADSSDDAVPRGASTNNDGHYWLAELPPATYRIRVTAPGYQAREIYDLAVTVAGYLDINFDLRSLRDVWESGYNHSVIFPDEAVIPFFGPDVAPGYSIELRPDTGTTGQLEPSISEVLDPRLIEQLPLAGRDVYSALVLLPGVTSDTATVRSLGLSDNGQRPTSSDFLLDGVENNNHVTTGSLPLPPEAVDEYRVSTNNFSAEYGGTSGYIANAVTRRGGNAWRGILYGNFEDRFLDANTFQHNANGIPQPPYHETQSGFWVGGPLPWKGLFAAASFEYFNSHSYADPLTLYMPTLQFVDSLPAGSTAARLFQLHPATQYAPASDGDAGNVSFLPPVNLTQWTGLTRLDYEPSGSQHVSIRVAPVRLQRPDFIWTPYGDGGLNQSSNSVAANLTSVWSSRFTSEFTAGWEGDSLGWNLADSDLPAVSFSAGPLLPGSSSGFYYDGPGYHDRSHSLSAGGTLIWALGKHILKAGGKFSTRSLHDSFAIEPHGFYTFPDGASFAMDQPSELELPLSRLGILSGTFTAPTSGNYRYTDSSGFVQEDFRATPNLTLNAGVRYEWYGAPQILSGTLDATLAAPGGDLRENIANATLVPAGSEVFHMQSGGWAARVAASYAPPVFKQRVVFRGGYGMFYDPLYDNLWSSASSNDIALADFGAPCNFSGNYLASPPGLNKQCFQGTSDFLNLTTFVPLRLPLVHSFFLGSQTRLSNSWTLEVNGIGSIGSGLITTDVINRDQGQGPPNPALPDVYYRTNQGESQYSALTVSARYQSAHAMARVFYTWSRSIDNQSDPLLGDFFDLGFSNQTDRSGKTYYGAFTLENNPNADRADSDFDQRQNLVAFGYWEPPGFSGKGIAALSRNWRMSGTFVVRSGLPYSVYAGVQNCQPICNTRAGLVNPALLHSAPQAVPGGVQLLNPAAFAIPPDGVNGSTGRNEFTGPGFWNIDFSLGRRFPLTRLSEHASLELRADAFNVMNHANLQAPANYLGVVPTFLNSDFGSALYGRTSNPGFPALTPFVENARQVQILVRFEF
ncbi:MAG TPA: carboxypeptidase regulatory-like domain-containing protein [Bryobacteraceae bacterium]|nr:carboxypeptidase regulatory-like domain-containing protein [Bryobacteraceae bacterium]